MLRILEIITSTHKLKHKIAISKSVEQLLVAPTDITKYTSVSIYIHKTFVNLLSKIYGWLIDHTKSSSKPIYTVYIPIFIFVYKIVFYAQIF